MRRLATLVMRRRRLVLAVSVLFLPLAALLGGGVERHLSSGGFTDPASESARATEALATEFRSGTPNLLLLCWRRSATA